MKIIGLETFRVPPRWLFLAVHTDEGITGWGEPIVEGRAETVQAAIEEMSHRLIGSDPTRIEDTWQLLTRGGFYRGGPILSSAVAGIDQALWDIAGKVHGVPVYDLLGGPVRDRVRVYGWIGGDRPSALAEDTQRQIEAGLTAVKMNGSAQLTSVDSPGASMSWSNGWVPSGRSSDPTAMWPSTSTAATHRPWLVGHYHYSSRSGRSSSRNRSSPN